ncbi:type 4 fimbrial biogenesis protein PilO [Methylocaldum marinum]|uniref:Type 4 fimbrial biogenesis protein PilO n=1 Tax=Methylocaldum marinum TaxID=1432792 RepID=A0A250L3A3_9GAMM|nr:type 4a pilus biogenesis protein PilO [Methylocaldum marinum]BBA37239.1 type 4 fimbrial biogenesis protein PilO [Methylocaldum marinum]
MNLSEVNWDIENAGAWPVPVKVGIITLLCLVLGGLWYYLDTQDQIALLEAEETKERELKTKFEQRQRKAVNLEEYKEQMAEMEKSFGDLLRQLPDKTQVPELLVDVSQTGLAAGLEFELFKPAAEIAKEFYAELPIEIRVVGDYMEFGEFISGLASLPRIVTIHNVKIAAHKKSDGAKKNVKEPLVMSALVRTYRYLDEGSAPAVQVKKPQPKRK